MYTQLQAREVFHLEFLRWFSRKVKSKYYALKGGVNLRFFYKSLRYSEDMDLDASGIQKYILQDSVMKILGSASFQSALKPFGIERVVLPDIAKAKQTKTTQRFKIHLINYAGEDLFTKIEFSRRGFNGEIVTESVSNNITRMYKLPPLIVPHYTIDSAVKQKIKAINMRAVTQARDIFDLYALSSQYKDSKKESLQLSHSELKEAREKIFDISFEEFRDTVVAYFMDEEQNIYGNKEIWDEIKLTTSHFLEELSAKNG